MIAFLVILAICCFGVEAVKTVIAFAVNGWPASKVDEGIVRAELESATCQTRKPVWFINTPHGLISDTDAWIAPFSYSNTSQFRVTIWRWSPLVKQIQRASKTLPRYSVKTAY